MNAFVPFKLLFEKLFRFGLAVASEEVAADLAEQGNAARKRGLVATLEAIDFANELPDGGDAAKREAIALFRGASLEQARALQRLLAEPAPNGDGSGRLARPSIGASTTATDSPEGSGPRAIEDGRDGGPTAPARRPRGRPRKDRGDAS